MSLPARLKQARESLEKSQKEMANFIGISFRSWQGYENGKNEPGSKVIEALTKIGGFNANWILAGKGKMNNDSVLLDKKVLNNNEISKSFSFCTNVILEYQDGLKVKMSNEEHGKLLYVLWQIVINQNSEWQTEEKVKEILEAILKISKDFEILKKLKMGSEAIDAFYDILLNL